MEHTDTMTNNFITFLRSTARCMLNGLNFKMTGNEYLVVLIDQHCMCKRKLFNEVHSHLNTQYKNCRRQRIRKFGAGTDHGHTFDAAYRSSGFRIDRMRKSFSRELEVLFIIS